MQWNVVCIYLLRGTYIDIRVVHMHAKKINLRYNYIGTLTLWNRLYRAENDQNWDFQGTLKAEYQTKNLKWVFLLHHNVKYLHYGITVLLWTVFLLARMFLNVQNGQKIGQNRQKWDLNDRVPSKMW